MEQKCRNCDCTVDSNFCGNCGQSIKVNRLNWHYLVDEFQHSIIHADKGILYTIKRLLVKPEAAIANYLNGKRVGMFKPFGFLVILATINGLLSQLLGIVYTIDFAGLEVEVNKEIANNNLIITEWIYSHYSLVSLVSIIPVSFFSWIIYKKSKLVFVEHLVLNAYLLGMQCLIFSALIPIYFLSDNSYFEIASLLGLLYFIWAYIKLFNKNNLFIAILKSLLVLIFYFISLAIIGMIGGFVWVLFSAK